MDASEYEQKKSDIIAKITELKQTIQKKMPINTYESAVRSCFKDEIESVWYGGTEGKIGDDPNNMYVAITEGPNWWQNKCVLRDWFFDYEKFKTLPLELDCASYGVYVISMKKEKS